MYTDQVLTAILHLTPGGAVGKLEGYFSWRFSLLYSNTSVVSLRGNESVFSHFYKPLRGSEHGLNKHLRVYGPLQLKLNMDLPNPPEGKQRVAALDELHCTLFNTRASES